ncbi:MAG: PEP-CTERM sorting domain-containing protein [Akkermansiaceae bacterium]|jgi:hypothetical protein
MKIHNKTIGLSLLALGAMPTMAAVTASFAHDGTGISGTPPFLIPGGGASITLAFAIDGAGVVSLNASTSSPNATAIALIDQWDNTTAGTVAAPALFGQSFTLTGTAINSLGVAQYSLTELDGGGLGVQGENSNRIDGKGLASPNPEGLVWTLSGTVGLNFTNWNYIQAANAASLEISDGDTTFVTGDLNATNTLAGGISSQSLLGENLSLADGEALTFGASNQGAALGGFTFDVTSPIPEPSTGLLSVLALLMVTKRRR